MVVSFVSTDTMVSARHFSEVVPEFGMAAEGFKRSQQSCSIEHDKREGDHDPFHNRESGNGRVGATFPKRSVSLVSSRALVSRKTNSPVRL